MIEDWQSQARFGFDVKKVDNHCRLVRNGMIRKAVLKKNSFLLLLLLRLKVYLLCFAFYLGIYLFCN